MKAKPNQTLLEGTVRAIHPDAGGYGSNVEIEVSRNLSRVADADFLRPRRGDRLTLFTAEAPPVEVGQRVRVQARLLGGPFGERRILEHLEVIEH
jgi:acyl-coenzyme A thioesterase PaaI-like protein